MRSDYLDNLSVGRGDVVICKAAICSSFTPGKTYVVQSDKTLIDDEGNNIFPSARFTIPSAQSLALR